MRANVREQVVDRLPQPNAIAEHDQRDGRDLDRPVGLDGVGGLDRLGDERAEVDPRALERPALVEPGEQEQIIDEHAHSLRLAFDAAHRARQIVGPRLGAALEQLGVRADGRERRAQLVRRVGDEPAQLSLGRLERAKRRLDLRQHRVQGDPETADFGSWLGALDPLREVARGDRRSRPADRDERLQAEAHDPEPERDDRREHERGHEQLDQQQPVERALDAGQRSGDDQDVVRLVRLDRRADAEMTVAADRRHGEEDDTVSAAGSGGQLDRLRQLRLRAAGSALELRHEAGLAADDRAIEAPELDVVAGHRCRQVGDARPRPMTTAVRYRPALAV